MTSNLFAGHCLYGSVYILSKKKPLCGDNAWNCSMILEFCDFTEHTYTTIKAELLRDSAYLTLALAIIIQIENV